MVNLFTLIRGHEIRITKEINFQRAATLINGNSWNWSKSKIFAKNEHKVYKLIYSDLPEIEWRH